MIIAIDPGPEFSAVVELDRNYTRGSIADYDRPHIDAQDQTPNEKVLDMVDVTGGVIHANDIVVIERCTPQAQPLGWDVQQTIEWAAFFYITAKNVGICGVHWVTRAQVRTHLGGHVAATRTQVEQVTMDRFGPGRRAAIGTKDEPGPLFCITPKSSKTGPSWGHCWAALALAITWEETHVADLAQDPA